MTVYLAQTHRVSPDRFSPAGRPRHAFRSAAERARRASTREFEVEIGYSVKTSPDASTLIWP